MAREVFSRPKHPVGRKLHTDYSRSDHGDELAPTPQAVLSIAARSRVSLIIVRPLHSRVLCIFSRRASVVSRKTIHS